MPFNILFNSHLTCQPPTVSAAFMEAVMGVWKATITKTGTLKAHDCEKSSSLFLGGQGLPRKYLEVRHPVVFILEMEVWIT